MTHTAERSGLAYASGAQAAVLRESVTELIRRQTAAYADRPAVIWRDGTELRSLTYREFTEAINAIAYRLRHLEPGSRVGVWSRNCVEFVLLELAIGTRGLMMCALNTAWTDTEARHAVEMVEPSIIFAGFDGLGRPLLERARGLVGDVPVQDIASLTGLPGAPDSFLDVDPQVPYIVQFTSGTTGFPKGAMISQAAAINGGWLRLQNSATPDDVSLNAVPLHHVGGAVSIVFGAVTTGSAFVVLSKFDVEEFVDLLGEVGGTHFGGVPIMVERLLNHPDIRIKGARVKGVGLGGADISPHLIRRVNAELGAEVLATYGQSECPFISNTVGGDDPEVIATTAGRPGNATELRIVSPETGEVARFGEIGEIQVSSPMVMLGYYGDAERTAEVLPGDGFLRTGDLGSLDEDGYLRINGRSREVIIRGGENIYPAEVEAALSTHPAVSTSAVVGLGDPSWGETVGASIVCSDPTLSGPDLEEYLTERLAHFKIPRTWRFVPDLPMTASGKIRRVEVKAEMNNAAGSA